MLYGKESFERIHNSSIIIVGLGGVGYMAAEALLRSGVGKITLVDCDIIEESDFNRHILALEENIGKDKVASAYERLRRINNEAEIVPKSIFFHKDTAQQIFSERYDFLIDAIDALSPKIELIKYALTNRIDFISTMGAARRRDISQIRVCRISQPTNCPLSRLIRKRLHRDWIYEDFYVVSSSEKIEAVPVKSNEKMFFERGRKRDILPSSMIVPAIFGLCAADYAIGQIIRLNTENK